MFYTAFPIMDDNPLKKKKLQTVLGIFLSMNNNALKENKLQKI